MNKSLRALLVEDSVDDAELVVRSLRRSGFAVTAVRVDRREAMETALASQDWDVIIADHAMPHFSLTGVLDLLQETHNTTPCIVVSGTIPEGTATEALRRGAVDFIHKDRLSRLVPAVERELQEVEARRARQHAEQQVKLLRSALNAVEDAVVITGAGPDSPAVFANLAETGGVVGRNVEAGDLIPAGVQMDQIAQKRLHNALAKGQPFHAEVTGTRTDGSPSVYELQLTPVRGASGQVTNWVSVRREVTERRAFVAALRRQAMHDPLTGLPNRALFLERLQQALPRAAKRPLAVLLLDLDRFKLINDSLGHDVGDQVLSAVAERLQTVLGDAGSAARLDGDEFAILLETTAGRTEAVAVAQQVLKQLQVPIPAGGHHLTVSVSIGVAMSTSTLDRPEDLLRRADVALNRVKHNGRAGHEVFDPAMNAALFGRLDLETDLRRAIQRAEFVVNYQPVISLHDQRVTGVEALVRWRHPQRGEVAPADFIPVAEETGLLVPISRWVLAEACRQVRAWQLECPSDPPLMLYANLSARQFQHPGLIDDIRQALWLSGLDPSCLRLEITETAAMQDAEATVGTLQALRALGIHLAIDDFGTGYSSLSYLRRFPVDTLKVDRTFVQGIGQDADATAVVGAMINLAKTMGLAVTAEGIETEAQLDHLVALGCEQGQGYYFARPLPAPELRQLLIGVPH